jgi:predicted chitinase
VITKEELQRWSPKIKPAYLDAWETPGSWDILTYFQVATDLRSLLAFLANFGHETAGGTIEVESLNYLSGARLAAVWPSRFRGKSEAELAPLLRNPSNLAEAVYGGRMGNIRGKLVQGPDGQAISMALAFAGHSWLQTTGYGHYRELAEKCGLGADFFDQHPHMTSNHTVMLRMAACEWYHSGAAQYAAAGRFDEASAIINTGKPNPSKCIGLPDRQLWHKRAWNIWGNDPDVMQEPAALVDDSDENGDTPPGQAEHWSEFIDMDGDGIDDHLQR